MAQEAESIRQSDNYDEDDQELEDGEIRNTDEVILLDEIAANEEMNEESKIEE